jgi:hypothetical protein
MNRSNKARLRVSRRGTLAYRRADFSAQVPWAKTTGDALEMAI